MASGSRLTVISRVAKTPELRRINLAFLGYSISEHATWLAIAFYALERGGPAEVGIAAAAQLLPGVVLTPFSSYAGDRFRPHRALAIGYLVQCVAMAATAVAMASGAGGVTYVFGALAATAISFTRPVMGALLPTVTHAPADLVAANVVVGIIEQLGIFLGPVGAGILLAVGSPAAVFWGGAGLTGIAFVAIGLMRIDDIGRHAPSGRAVLAQMGAGFAALRRSSTLMLLMVFVAAAGLVRGISDVIFVVFADERLQAGGGASGFLAVVCGIGGLVAATTVTRLGHGGRPSRHFLAAALCGCVGLAGLAIASSYVSSGMAFALLGASDALLVLTATITVQRISPTFVLARIFGILEGVQMGFIAVGAYFVSVLTSSLSLGRALSIMAVVLAVLLLTAVAAFHRRGDVIPPVDAFVVDRLLADPIFAPLPAPVIERLAHAAETIRLPAGTTIITEGDHGDRYYLVVDGSIEVTIAGAHVRDLGEGRSFGEIALLRDRKRSATVTATTDIVLLTVDRDEFLASVNGHPRSFGTATAVADHWLGSN